MRRGLPGAPPPWHRSRKSSGQGTRVSIRSLPRPKSCPPSDIPAVPWKRWPDVSPRSLQRPASGVKQFDHADLQFKTQEDYPHIVQKPRNFVAPGRRRPLVGAGARYPARAAQWLPARNRLGNRPAAGHSGRRLRPAMLTPGKRQTGLSRSTNSQAIPNCCATCSASARTP